MYTDKTAVLNDLVNFGRRVAHEKLVVGPGGNTSIRLSRAEGDIIYMKASGRCFEDGNQADYIGVDPATATVCDGALKPTCEIHLHLACYAERPDVHAVLHSHAPIATAYAMRGEPLRAFTPDMVAVVGELVPVVEYIPPAGTELAETCRPLLRAHNAILLKNHGLLAVGSTMKEAFYRTMVIEDAVRTMLAACVFGAMHFFTPEQAAQINGMDAEKYRREMLKKTC